MANKNPNQEMNLILTADQKEPAMIENEVKDDMSGDAGMQDPKQTQKDEEKVIEKEKVEAKALVGTHMKGQIESAINYIIGDNTSDFKDFYFPMKKMDILYYRMHLMISDRIKELKITEVDDALDIIETYRNRHPKDDDIQFLTNTYKSLQPDDDEMPTGEDAAASANAGPSQAVAMDNPEGSVADPRDGPDAASANTMPMPGSSQAVAMDNPEGSVADPRDGPDAASANTMPMPGSSQAVAMDNSEGAMEGPRARIAQEDKLNKKKTGSQKRFVRFQTPGNYRECFPDQPETKEE